ncbi:cyclase [Fusarium albosuccineum]|uniref:Cyclase n=1 Tax=Fusarium albosuccineum TaxID=1237068 RepID=A0A8H4L7Q3_9HYPO|nr:cyclase [Fusarium albosuccineum]
MNVPKYSELPSVAGRPRHCSWDVWNEIHEHVTGRKGQKDWSGTLNHLTAEVVAAAGKEIQTGERAALNWPLDAYTYVGFQRKKLELGIIDGKAVTGGKFLANDDEVTSTRERRVVSNSCFRSRSIPKLALSGMGCAISVTALYYNGATHEELQNGRENRPGSIHEWSKMGGICGRGVLLDYYAYAQKHSIDYCPGDTHNITVESLENVATWENVELRPGDILLVRTGWTSWHDSLIDEAKKIALTRDKHDNAGLLPSEETAEWIWDRRFAAIAADNPTVETWPPTGKGQLLHEYLLPTLGCPIGELWDLEKLSALCEKNKRYSFFLSSAPLNISGAIATPANAVAIL